MARIDVRNIPDDVVAKLSERAKHSGMSREAYVRHILTVAANEDILKESEGRYNTLVNEYIDLAKEQGEIIERNTMMMQLLYDKLG